MNNLKARVIKLEGQMEDVEQKLAEHREVMNGLQRSVNGLSSLMAELLRDMMELQDGFDEDAPKAREGEWVEGESGAVYRIG